MQNYCAPKHDQYRAVFLRVPAPETSPRLIGPNAAKNGADKTEQGRKTNHSISHAGERIGGVFFQRTREDTANDVNDGEHTGEEHRGIAGRDRDHVSGEPDVGVKHGL